MGFSGIISCLPNYFFNQRSSFVAMFNLNAVTTIGDFKCLSSLPQDNNKQTEESKMVIQIEKSNPAEKAFFFLFCLASFTKHKENPGDQLHGSHSKCLVLLEGGGL